MYKLNCSYGKVSHTLNPLRYNESKGAVPWLQNTFLRKTMRVREIVILVHFSHSHSFAQKRNAFRIHGTAPLARKYTSVRASVSLTLVMTQLKIGRDSDPDVSGRYS